MACGAFQIRTNICSIPYIVPKRHTCDWRSRIKHISMPRVAGWLVHLSAFVDFCSRQLSEGCFVVLRNCASANNGVFKNHGTLPFL